MITFNQTIEVTKNTLIEYIDLYPLNEKPYIVRDMTGAVTVILPDNLLNPDKRRDLTHALHLALGRYSPGERRVLLTISDLIDREDIIDSPYRVDSPCGALYLIDRMPSNQEWLRAPIVQTLPIPTATAFSVKGGVGRSTAVAVWAWGLARQGKNVLVIDLDLEAPGLSSLLLDRLPQYGLVDWMVESLVQQPDAHLLDEMIQTSPLSQACAGTIRVIPAYGSEEKDYVAKLGRIYMPTLNETGDFYGIAHRLNALLQTMAETLDSPDAVLLDARAGLHDIGAAVLSQLPTEVFLFARDEKQTWQSYQHLFHHLRQSCCVKWGMADTDLRWRLHMVAAQLGGSEQDFKEAISHSNDTWTTLYDEASPDKDGTEIHSFQEFDTNGPHYPIPIYFNSLISRRGLADKNSRPRWEVVEAAFGAFIHKATERLFPLQTIGPDGDSHD